MFVLYNLFELPPFIGCVLKSHHFDSFIAFEKKNLFRKNKIH